MIFLIIYLLCTSPQKTKFIYIVIILHTHTEFSGRLSVPSPPKAGCIENEKDGSPVLNPRKYEHLY